MRIKTKSFSADSHAISVRSSTQPALQYGVALVVVMMFIVILSGIAAYSARRAISGEGMSRNQLDAEIARQASEAALRDAEIDLQIKSATILPNAACARLDKARPITTSNAGSTGEKYFGPLCPLGQCRLAPSGREADYAAEANATTNTNPQPWWPATNLWNNNFGQKPPDSAACSFNGGVPLGTFSGAARLRGVIRQPEYMIEYMVRGEQNYFRITSRGWGLSNNSEVVMQSYFTTMNQN